ncbi:uncharacterized protein BN473_02407 [Prevotella sp. CAG:1185]|nr:uncharacterized protein BN473_02407 [Prevotella sp. CAG:1185]
MPFCLSLTLSTAFNTSNEYPLSSAVFIKALTSFGKHDPPYPQPAYRNFRPIRVSDPIPERTLLISAPTNSHKLAISFIKLIRVASIEFAAYFVISALGISINITRKLFSKNGLYNFVNIFFAFSLLTPTTTLSGLIKSLIALPSFKNSGLLATSNGTSTPRLASSAFIVSEILFDVPTGTVLLVTTTK